MKYLAFTSSIEIQNYYKIVQTVINFRFYSIPGVTFELVNYNQHLNRRKTEKLLRLKNKIRKDASG